jgi:hypothetical protein
VLAHPFTLKLEGSALKRGLQELALTSAWAALEVYYSEHTPDDAAAYRRAGRGTRP